MPRTIPTRRTLASALIALGLCGCGLTPNIPDSQELAAAEKAGRTYDSYAAALVEGYDAWGRRHESPDFVRAAVKAWERAYAIDPFDRRLLQHLTLSYYYLGNYYTPEGEQRDDVHRRGYDFGVLAARANPKIAAALDAGAKLEDAVSQHAVPGDVPGLYWMVVNLARAVENKSVATRAGIAPQLKVCMETIYRLGPKYYWGGVHRFFGGYYVKAPGQSDPGAQSKREFERAVQVGPENLENKVLMAEYWATFVQDRDAYERILKEVLATDPANDIPALRLDNAEARKRAKRLLEEIDDRL
jgi:tetratricopeptide (TPR) repeat protein